jgi:hypothetical protein
VTSVKQSANQAARQLLASKVLLVRQGEETTVYRFRLSETGARLARASVTRSLRGALRRSH